MAWCYELRGSENRLVETHFGFKSEEAARAAGQYAQCMIDCIGYGNSETLTLVTKEEGSTLESLAPRPDIDTRLISSRNVKPNLKYLWQQRALEAFLEPDPKNQLRKISLVEQAISDRVLDPAPFERDERIALGKLLPILRRLLREMAEPERESRYKDLG